MAGIVTSDWQRLQSWDPIILGEEENRTAVVRQVGRGLIPQIPGDMVDALPGVLHRFFPRYPLLPLDWCAR